MTTLTTAWMLGCVVGFFLGVPVASGRRPTCRELMRDPDPVRRRSFGPGPTTPKPPIIAKPQPPRSRTTAQRIYRGAMWREKGSDTWHPLGKEPDWAELARQSVTVQGLNWPATLGDFTLVGPADNQGAWRWYERQHNGATHRIKVDHQLQCLHQPVRPERPG
jgi:hypothetical protein